MSLIPEEIVSEVLTQLPARDLLRLRCVSKSWCSLIDSPFFINMHLNHSIASNSNNSLVFSDGMEIYCLPVEDVFDKNMNRKLKCPRKPSDCSVVLGSCNGLILLCAWYFQRGHVLSHRIKDFGIWNPINGEYKSLPYPPEPHKKDFSKYKYVSHGYGFGFDSTVTDNYKLVRVISFSSLDLSTILCEAEIYSLKSNSWTQVIDASIPLNMQYLDQTHGAFASGALHWAVKAPNSDLGILAFNIGIKNFSVIAMPDFTVKIRRFRIEEFNRKLCLSSLKEYNFVDIWIMGEYGVKESWKKLLSISTLPLQSRDGTLARPLAYLSSVKKILLKQRDAELVLYDLVKGTNEEIKIRQLNCSSVSFSCIDSLVQLSAYNNCY